ncbi:hypothetical protein [Lentibacillus amyloliquefaciens]|nr:hypothetical protein [Lentibacillus amyloliquefaciens]
MSHLGDYASATVHKGMDAIPDTAHYIRGKVKLHSAECSSR